MPKRKYTKKSEYWNNFKRVAPEAQKPQEVVEPMTAGAAYHVSQGSYSRSGSVSNLSSSSTSTRINRSSVTAPINKFSQIRAGMLPYEMASDGVNVRDAIELCQKALDENANRINKLELQSDRTTHTFNEILGGMLDGAMILDRDHIITFVNYSATKNFSLNQKMEGRRLEAFIDSFEILDLIDQLGRGLPPGKAEFTFRRNGTIKDFEVAIALLSSFRTESNDVYLLLFREVTEIKRADRLRKDFVANASHELRTPVTVIKGFAETLVETPTLPDSQRSSFISKIHKNSLRLQALVDDLLSLSELEGAEEEIGRAHV